MRTLSRSALFLLGLVLFLGACAAAPVRVAGPASGAMPKDGPRWGLTKLPIPLVAAPGVDPGTVRTLDELASKLNNEIGTLVFGKVRTAAGPAAGTIFVKPGRGVNVQTTLAGSEIGSAVISLPRAVPPADVLGALGRALGVNSASRSVLILWYRTY